MSIQQTQSNSNALAADARSLNALKLQAGGNSPGATKEAAKQFESLFMRELIKSMREATMKSGMLDSPGGNLGADLLDQQLAVQMSGKPGGLSELIAKQLSRQTAPDDAAQGTPDVQGAQSTPGVGDAPMRKALAMLAPHSANPINSTATSAPSTTAERLGPTASTVSMARPAAASIPLTAISTTAAPATAATNGIAPRISPLSAYAPVKPVPSHFVQRHAAAAAKIEKESGIPASFMMGQAGHETGWGKHEIKTTNGTPSYNLFGIKAGPGWTGKVATVSSTEYVNGEPKKVISKFRAYDSHEESYRDYAKLINTNPRYAEARKQTDSAYAFASGLQRAGYATDPDYAAKLSRAISTTQQVQRTQTTQVSGASTS